MYCTRMNFLPKIPLSFTFNCRHLPSFTHTYCPKSTTNHTTLLYLTTPASTGGEQCREKDWPTGHYSIGSEIKRKEIRMLLHFCQFLRVSLSDIHSHTYPFLDFELVRALKAFLWHKFLHSIPFTHAANFPRYTGLFRSLWPTFD